MKMMSSDIRKYFLAPWWCNRDGIAATEFALVFPILFMLLLGVIELGNGLLANQKVLSASQIVSDLLTRTEEVTDDQLEEALSAGRLAMNPFDTTDMGFDIISVRYDPDSGDMGTDPDPVILWRETENMDEIADVPEKVLPLALAHDGLLVVYVRFPYKPAFGTRIVGEINMIENTFARGRSVAVIPRVN